MQLANSMEGDSALRGRVRRATSGDAAAIQRLLKMGVYIHIHVDWRLPGEWLNRPGFMVFEKEVGRKNQDRNSSPVVACLAIAADPPPAAWVRVAAVESHTGYDQMNAMFGEILGELDPAINEIAWFLADYFPLHWLERMGFEQVSEVIGFRKEGLDVPGYVTPAGLVVRPLLMEDIPALTAIETAAFEPRWRHSAVDLGLAWRNSISFTVALVDDKPVAFQFSTGGGGTAHLSRMTVQPEWQGMGIGAALLAKAMESYRLQNIQTVTLNTQTDNIASRRLYERFGFRPTGYSYPIWSYFVSRPT